MKTAIMKLKDIHPAAYNPRVALKPGDAEYEALKNSLERFGVAEPLIVNETTGNLVSGHQRLNVLIESGAEVVEVVLIQADEEQEKLLNIALNKIDGEWDYEKLRELFDEISDDDIKFTGFSTEELNNLFDYECPEFDNLDDDDEAVSTETESDGKDEVAESSTAMKEFNIYLSFPSKEKAEAWLAEKGVDLKYTGSARNITIRMEGIDYGTGN